MFPLKKNQQNATSSDFYFYFFLELLRPQLLICNVSKSKKKFEKKNVIDAYSTVLSCLPMMYAKLPIEHRMPSATVVWFDVSGRRNFADAVEQGISRSACRTIPLLMNGGILFSFSTENFIRDTGIPRQAKRLEYGSCGRILFAFVKRKFMFTG